MRNNLLRICESVSVGMAGGFLFSLLQLPLPWMLGPLTSVALWRATTGRELEWPPLFRKLAMIVFGYTLGASFRGDTVRLIVEHLPYMLMTTVLLVVFSIGLGLAVSRLVGMGRQTGIFGFIPGGFAHLMALIEGSEKLNVTTIAFMQTIRAVTVIFLVPFVTTHFLSASGSPLAMPAPQPEPHGSLFAYGLFLLVAVGGALVGKPIRLPAHFLIGPMIAIAICAASGFAVPRIPAAGVTLAQLCLGIYLGRQIDGMQIKRVPKLFACMVASSLLLVGFALGQAYWLTIQTSLPLKTAFLSTAPGGIAEMGATAMTVKADLPLVSAYHTFRLFFIMLVVVPLFQWWGKRSVKQTTSARVSCDERDRIT